VRCLVGALVGLDVPRPAVRAADSTRESARQLGGAIKNLVQLWQLAGGADPLGRACAEAGEACRAALAAFWRHGGRA
jgi:hypothetical protein